MTEQPPAEPKHQNAPPEGAFRRRFPTHGIALTGILIIVGLLASELLVRLVDDRLPEQLQWHAWEAQHKVDQMDALRRANHGARIVMVGTSAMHFGFDPRSFDAELGGGRIAYNAALPGGVPPITELWASKVVLPRLHPKVLVVSVNSADLNDNGTSQKSFYDFFLTSPAARHLTGTETWLQRINRRLASWSDVWRFRWIIRRPYDLIRALRGEKIPTPGEPVGVDGVGLSRLTAHVVATPQRINGFIRRRRTNWLKNYAVGGTESGALLRLVREARAQGIAVVLVEMPVTQAYVDAHPHGQADIDAFHRTIDGIVSQTGAVYVDASRVAPSYDLFADFVHLNAKGSKVFSTFLADKLRQLGLA